MPEGAHEGETIGRRSAPAHRRSGASGTRSRDARSGGPFRIQWSSVADLAAVKRFGGNKGLAAVRDLRKRQGATNPPSKSESGRAKSLHNAKAVTFGMLFGAVSRRRRILRLGYRARQPEATLPAIAAWDHPDVPPPPTSPPRGSPFIATGCLRLPVWRQRAREFRYTGRRNRPHASRQETLCRARP